MKKILALLGLILPLHLAWATTVFDGDDVIIPLSAWELVNLQQSPDSTIEEIKAAPNRFQWLPANTAALPSKVAERTVARTSFSTRYEGSQRLLVSLQYAFVAPFTVVLRQNDKVIYEYRLEEYPATLHDRMRWTFGLISLPVLAPGDYELLVITRPQIINVLLRNATLSLEEDYLLHHHASKISKGSGYLGALITYLLIAILLLAIRPGVLHRSSLLFYFGAIVYLELGTGNLFYLVTLNNVWWMRHIYPISILWCNAGLFWFVSHELEQQKRQRSALTLKIISWILLGNSLLFLIQTADAQALPNILGIAVSLLGFILTIVFIILPLFRGSLHHFVFALFVGFFSLISLVRSLLSIANIYFSIEIWHLALSLVSVYIILQALIKANQAMLSDATNQTAVETRFDLVGRFSHELRTPLNAVIGLAELMKSSKDTQKIEHYAEMIHTAGNHLLHLVNDILDFSKLNQAELSIHHNPFRLDETLAKCYAIMLPRSISSRVKVLFRISPPIPFYLLGDDGRLQQVINNLLNNALKFSPPKSEIHLNVTQGRQQNKRVQLLFTLQDQGRGIPKEKLNTIFEPFNQVRREDSTLHGGTGLGLSICKLLIEQMGGEINVVSEENVGTTFNFSVWFTLDPAAPDLTELFAPIRDKSILLLTASPILVEQLGDAFRHWCNHITHAENIDAVPEIPYDLIVTETGFGRCQDSMNWLNSQSPTVAIEMIELAPLPADFQISHPNFRLLHTPCPLLFIFFSIISHVTGKPVAAGEIVQEDSLPLSQEHHVLIVDDNEVNLMVASKLLNSMGISTDKANGGLAVLEKLHGDNQYTLVLLDCEMPDLDGYEVCRRWREHERQHNLPPLKIVALTAHAMDEVKTLCLNCGMDDVIHKPVSKKTLIQVLNHYKPVSKPVSPTAANKSFADTSSKLP